MSRKTIGPDTFGRYYYKKDGRAAYNIKEPLEKILDNVDGYVEITREEWDALTTVPEPTQEELAEKARLEEIATLKGNLARTDYVAAKLAEATAKSVGVEALLEEYAEVLANREAWRERINELL